MTTTFKDKLRFHDKDVEFYQNSKTAWPSHDCKECARAHHLSCCKRTWHHTGDCCPHCGNDERDSLPIIVPTTERYYRKYRKLAEMYGAMVSLGRFSPTFIREQVVRDQHLNPPSPRTDLRLSLRNWDATNFLVVGRIHSLNTDGEDDRVPRTVSQAEATSLSKWVATYILAGCVPEFVEWNDPSLKGDYPRRPEWDVQSLQHLARLWSKRLDAHDRTHQGFSNAATWCARLYLAQERSFHEWLAVSRRKDGTVNANKVKRWFHQHGLKVDDWCLDHPLDVPETIRDMQSMLSRLPQVNWQEVADTFSEEAMK